MSTEAIIAIVLFLGAICKGFSETTRNNSTQKPKIPEQEILPPIRDIVKHREKP